MWQLFNTAAAWDGGKQEADKQEADQKTQKEKLGNKIHKGGFGKL